MNKETRQRMFEIILWIFTIAYIILPDGIIGPVDDLFLLITVFIWFRRIAKFLILMKDNLEGGAIATVVLFSILFWAVGWDWWIALLLSPFGYPVGAWLQSKLIGGNR